MRILDFADGFVSSTEPTIGSITVPNNRIQNFASDVAFVSYKGSVATEGDIYYNTTDHLIRYYKTSWVSLIDQNTTQVLQNKTVDGSSVGSNTVKTTALNVQVTPSGSLDSTNVQTALVELQTDVNTKENASNKGIASGYASLDGSGKVPSSQLPSYVDDALEYSNYVSLPVSGETGKIYVTLDANRTWRWTGSTYIEVSPNDVNSVNGQVGVVALDIDDLIDVDINTPTERQVLTFDSISSRWVNGVAISTGDGKNFITNGDAEANNLGWDVYADAAGLRPVDGIGGTANIVFDRSATSPLIGTGSFLFTKDAVNRQGQGASYAFTIDAAYKAKVLTIEFDYIVNSGTFVAGSRTTDSDLIAYIYDVTNSQLIEPSSIKLFSNSSTNSDVFKAAFQTSATGVNYRLILHCASASASAYELKIDNIKVSPSKYVYGSPISDWQIYTPTISTSSGTVTNATISARWRRVGSNIEISGRTTFSAASAVFSNFILSIPTGLIFDPVNTFFAVGEGKIYDAGSSQYPASITVQSTNTFLIFPGNSSGTYLLDNNMTNTVPFTFGNGDLIEFKLSAPIAGWSSSVQMSDSADTRVTVANVALTGTQAISTGTSANIILTTRTIENDTHGAYNTTTGFYIAPVSGFYRTKIRVNMTSAVYSNSSSFTALNIKKNNSTIDTIAYYQAPAAQTLPNQELKGDRVIFLKSGETVIVELSNSSGSSITINGGYTEFERVTGPSAISASENVFVEYTTATGQSMTASTLTRINYNLKIRDSHNAVTTGASWAFTAPRADTYIIEASFAPTAQAASSEKQLTVFKNGSSYRRIHRDRNASTVADDQGGMGSTSLYLLAGETIDVRGLVSTTQNLTTADSDNWITIKSQGGI